MTSASGLLLLAGAIAHVVSSGWQAAFVGHEAPAVPLTSKLLYLAAITTGAWFVALKGWRALVRLRPDMNLLMLVAVLGAIFINEFFEAATVAFLFAVSL